MLMQWYDIGAIIGVIFVGITMILTLAVYLEQRLDQPDLPSLGALAELAQPDDGGPEP
jgi:hypothetical protein